MAKGWSRDEFIQNQDVLPANTPISYSIQIYRTPVVEKMYGQTDLPSDPLVEKAILTGSTIEVQHAFAFDTVYPLVANETCIVCHGNARKGDILGALKVKQNIEPMVRDAGRRSSVFFCFFPPFPSCCPVSLPAGPVTRSRAPSATFRKKLPILITCRI